MKTLLDMVTWLRGSDESELSMKTMCLREPWTAQAEARVADLDEERRSPQDALSGGFKYFLEAFIAREVLEVLKTRPSKSSEEDACSLLIYYAKRDAYPDWVYR